MRVTIHPDTFSIIEGKKAAAPPSKSMAHRMLICAGLADGTSIIQNIAPSEDILATIDCLRALGAEAEYHAESMTAKVRGADPRAAAASLLPCRESGSTLRFLIPLCALSGSAATLTGSCRLMQRPLSVYEDIFARQGIELEKTDRTLMLKGRLKGGEYTVPGDISSQFVSGLLFALPLCREDSVIRLEGNIESRPYIEMTIRALTEHGVSAGWKSDAQISVPGGQRYKPTDAVIEGDWSNAANLIAAGAEVTGTDPNSLQGDKICAECFKRLDAGRAELDISDCPDLGPVLMAYAALKHGAVLTGTRRLRYKESDRGLAMQTELAKFGIETCIQDDSITVGSGPQAPEQILSGHNDHRIVMALTALCLRTGGVIDGAEAVNKSFPDYFDQLTELGALIDKEN